MKPMLPLVDPDYLILESDPDKLRAYARGLLLQLRNPSRSYSLELVKAATVWLVGAYVDARLPLAPEMAALIAGVVKWNRRAGTLRKVQEKNANAYWSAIRFEAKKPADRNGKAPSAASLYAVAKHVREEVGSRSIGRADRETRRTGRDPMRPRRARKPPSRTGGNWTITSETCASTAIRVLLPGKGSDK